MAPAAVAVAVALVSNSPQEPRDLAALLRASPHAELFAPLLADPAAHRLQILVAEPVVADDRIVLRRSALGDPAQYFYPASSIKICGAVAALLETNEQSDAESAFGLASEVTIQPRFRGDEERVEPSLAHMLTKLFVVSDNAAYNHCLEIVGFDRVNRRMWDAGFDSVRLWHRLSEARTSAENRQTRGVDLTTHRPGGGGDSVQMPARDTPIDLANDLWHDLDCGTAWLRDGERVEGPMSFAAKNAIRLRDLQDLLVELVRPEIDTGKLGFPGLSVDQRAFVVSRLGMLPRESTDPPFDPATFPDHWSKFVLRGVRRVVSPDSLRIYDKSGRAYGFSIENAYVEETTTGRGFFLAAVLYTNPDGVLNDDRYAYEETADPVLDAIGETIARAVFRPESR